MTDDMRDAAIDAMRLYFATHLKMIEAWREAIAEQEVEAFLASLAEKRDA